MPTEIISVIQTLTPMVVALIGGYIALKVKATKVVADATHVLVNQKMTDQLNINSELLNTIISLRVALSALQNKLPTAQAGPEVPITSAELATPVVPVEVPSIRVVGLPPKNTV